MAKINQSKTKDERKQQQIYYKELKEKIGHSLVLGAF